MKYVLKHTFSLLNADHVRLDTHWNYRHIVSPYYRIYYIADGEGQITDSLQTHVLEQGYLYIIPSFTLCSLSCQTHLEQYFVQFFEQAPDGSSLFAQHRRVMKVKAQETDLENFKRLLAINPGRGLYRSDDPSVYEKNLFYKAYQQLNNHQHLSAFLETQGILLQFIARFLDTEWYSNRGSVFIPDVIQECISYLIMNLDADLSVKLLAKRANYHSDYFSRLFEKHMGINLPNFVNDKRIERAQHLMLARQLTFAQIAQQTGFKSQPYFSKVFKQVTGLTPRQFMASAR